MNWLVADWGDNKQHVFRPVIASLRALNHGVRSMPRNETPKRPELVAAIRSGEFDVLLTWQRFYPMQDDIRSAVQESGIRTVYMDYGFIPHYGSVVFDTAGENACSSWPSNWASGSVPEPSGDARREAERLMAEQAAAARRATPPDIREVRNLRQPFVFVPLQRPGDSVVRYDSSVHDFGKLLRHVLWLARGRYQVVCKVHPLDRELKLGVPDELPGSHAVIRYPSGRSNDALNDYMLSRAALVVGVNSNMLFRAVLLGTPVIATGRGWYSGSGALQEVGGIEGLTSLEAPPAAYTAQVRYVARCLERQLRFEELGSPQRVGAMLERLSITEAAAQGAL